MKIQTGDTVKVILGKYRGKEGVVERVYLQSKKVLVKGINIYKKHVQKSEASPKGGVVEVNRPLLASKVMVVCPSCKKSVRVVYEIGENKRKMRLCKKCKKVIVHKK